MAGDKSWCHFYDSEAKPASSQWKAAGSSTLTKKPIQLSQFEHHDADLFIITFEKFLTRDSFSVCRDVNQVFYFKLLRRLRENVRRKYPSLWRSCYWLLHRWQWIRTDCFECAAVLDLSGYYTHVPSFLFSRPRPPRPFSFVFRNERGHERGAIWKR